MLATTGSIRGESPLSAISFACLGSQRAWAGGSRLRVSCYGMSWHLTVGETAFLAPGGVILGAIVSYFAVRKSAIDNLRAQEKTIVANREIAEASQQFETARELSRHAEAASKEAREHRRSAYAEVMQILGPLQDLILGLSTAILLQRKTGRVNPGILPKDFQSLWSYFEEFADKFAEYLRVSGPIIALSGSNEMRQTFTYLTIPEVFVRYYCKLPKDLTPTKTEFFWYNNIEDEILINYFIKPAGLESASYLRGMELTLATLDRIFHWQVGKMREEVGSGDKIPEFFLKATESREHESFPPDL